VNKSINSIPTEPVGSVPRPRELQEAMVAFSENKMSAQELDTIFDKHVKETIDRFEETGSPVISDGEQTKSSFATYPLDGLDNIAPDGVVIPFEDGHTRQLPKLTKGPFKYATYAGSYFTAREKICVKACEAGGYIGLCYKFAVSSGGDSGLFT